MRSLYVYHVHYHDKLLLRDKILDAEENASKTATITYYFLSWLMPISQSEKSPFGIKCPLIRNFLSAK